MRGIAAIAAGFVLLSGLGSPAMAKGRKVASINITPEMMAETTPDFSREGFEKVFGKFSLKRHVAQGAKYDEGDLSPAFKKFRDEALNVKNAEELEAFLAKYDASYDQLTPDVQFIVAQLQLMTPLRGLAYRLRPIFEHNRSVQSGAVTMLKSTASLMKIYLPTPQWEAAWEYVTLPSVSKTEMNTQFQTMTEFQNYLISQFRVYNKSLVRVSNLLKTYQGKPFVYDNKILYGPGTFRDDMDRYRVNDLPEIAATLSGLYGTLASIQMFCAYDHDDLLSVTRDMGRLAGVDGFLPGDLGVSAKDRSAILKKPKYAKFLTLRPNYGAKLMGAALVNMQASTYLATNAWEQLKDRPANFFAVMDPAMFTPNSRAINLHFKSLNDMVQSKTTIRSPITDEVVTTDVPKFFQNPPQDLKVFLPIGFDTSPEMKTLTTKTGEQLQYRNYFRGRPTAWNNAAWAPYFPSAQDNMNDPDYVAKILNVMQQSWGANYVVPTLDWIAR